MERLPQRDLVRRTRHGALGAPSGKPGKLRQAVELSRGRSPDQIRAVVEPAVAGLIGSVVAVLRAEDRPPLPVSCPSLAEAYEEFIAQVRISETPADWPVFMTPGGILMMAGTPSGTIPLAEYLDRLIHLPAQLPAEAPGLQG